MLLVRINEKKIKMLKYSQGLEIGKKILFSIILDPASHQGVHSIQNRRGKINSINNLPRIFAARDSSKLLNSEVVAEKKLFKLQGHLIFITYS